MEQVILVDEQNNQVGVADKESVHTTNTPLHRAFSLFLFNNKKQLLLTKRASTKKTFPGVWTNSVCGHVSPGETPIDAVKRRVQEELKIHISDVYEEAPYRYRFTDNNGVVENEICPIFVARTNEQPVLNVREVDDFKWIDWNTFIETIQKHPGSYSPWSEEEALILQQKDLELLR